MEVLFTSEGIVALLTLTFLEIVLGVDNIIFISIISNRLPQPQQRLARNLGLFLALVMRILLLLGISWIIGFTEPLFSVYEHPVSIKDIILIVGGLFLIGKSTTEIHESLEIEDETHEDKVRTTLAKVIFQIVALDMVFSFDSILTAIGLTPEIVIMIVAVTIAMIVMMSFAGRISAFINKHPSLQLLAMSFLILIGFMLVLEGIGEHIAKGYIYFAVFFSLTVELLNMRRRRNQRVFRLRKKIR
jgi:predicted tellurium resistance membrane protein TerC